MYDYEFSKTNVNNGEKIYMYFKCPYSRRPIAYADCKAGTLQLRPTEHPRIIKSQEMIKKDYPEYKVIPW